MPAGVIPSAEFKLFTTVVLHLQTIASHHPGSPASVRSLNAIPKEHSSSRPTARWVNSTCIRRPPVQSYNRHKMQLRPVTVFCGRLRVELGISSGQPIRPVHIEPRLLIEASVESWVPADTIFPPVSVAMESNAPGRSEGTTGIDARFMMHYGNRPVRRDSPSGASWTRDRHGQ